MLKKQVARRRLRSCIGIFIMAGAVSLVVINWSRIVRAKRPVPARDIHIIIGDKIPVSAEIKPTCELRNKGRCYGQCCEDHRMFERFFSNPVVCHGTYVEIGAINGLTLSNTKFFEDSLGWSGVLIEGDPTQSKLLKKNRPNSITREMAICREGERKVNFTLNSTAVGGVLKNLSQRHIKNWKINTSNVVEVPCMPMGKLLREAGITSIDLFSLDVEGSEMVVLETMDWTIPVKYFIIETFGPKDTINQLKAFLADKGFHPVPRLKREGCWFNTVFKNAQLVG